MSVHLMCLTSNGGLPIFTRKRGDCDCLPFSTVASLNGTHMFCKSQGVELKSTHTEDWVIVWKDFEKTITVIVAGKGMTEKMLSNLIELVFNTFVMFVGLDELKSSKFIDRMKREAKNYIPVIDKLLETIDSELLAYCECILAAENFQILSRLNEFSSHFGSLFCSVVINQKLSAATEGWWDLDVIDRKLLMTILNASGSLQKDIPIFLPKKSPNTAYRFVSIPITGTATLCVICGADPPYNDISNVVHQIWKSDLETLQIAERCMPRNFPDNIDIDQSILGILLISNVHKKYVISRNLQQSSSGKRTMSGSHRIDILRTFFNQAVDVIENYLNVSDEKCNKVTDNHLKVTESYWCSEYHKCHAYIDGDGNLICVLYVASVPTYSMRLLTQKTLSTITQEKLVCW